MAAATKFNMGESMAEFIWHWTKGNKKIYTRKTDIAERAMKEGFLVMGVKTRPSILRINPQ